MMLRKKRKTAIKGCLSSDSIYRKYKEEKPKYPVHISSNGMDTFPRREHGGGKGLLNFCSHSFLIWMLVTQVHSVHEHCLSWTYMTAVVNFMSTWLGHSAEIFVEESSGCLESIWDEINIRDSKLSKVDEPLQYGWA